MTITPLLFTPCRLIADLLITGYFLPILVFAIHRTFRSSFQHAKFFPISNSLADEDFPLLGRFPGCAWCVRSGSASDSGSISSEDGQSLGDHQFLGRS